MKTISVILYTADHILYTVYRESGVRTEREREKS